MRIDYVLPAELMSKDLAILLFDPNVEVFSLVAPIGVAHPNLIFAGARNFDVLPDRAPRLVRAGGYGVPLAFAALRPLGRNARSVDSPTRSPRRRQFEIRRIQEGFMPRRLRNAPHVLGFIPEILERWRQGDRLMGRRGEAKARG